MKKTVHLLVALLLTAMPLLQAQNPVRNLKAEVERNRYVRLSWDRPVTEASADVILSEPSEATFDLWKKEIYGSFSMVRFGDTILCGQRSEKKDTVPEYPTGRVTTKMWKEVRLADKYAEDGSTLDYWNCTLLKVYDTVTVVEAGSSSRKFDTASKMLKVGDYVYARCDARNYGRFINKYRFDDWEQVQTINQIVPDGGREEIIQALTYVPDLNEGKGALLISFEKKDQYQFLSLDGELLENAPVFELDAVEKTEGKTWQIGGIVYYDSTYYILGDDGVRSGASNSRTFYIDAFDFNGKYLGRKKDLLADYTPGKMYYSNPDHFFVMTDAKTRNVYLAVMLDRGNAWYYEIATVPALKYDVKRDGTELTEDDYKRFYFLDTLKDPGSYTYAVAARYGTHVVSPDAEVKVTIAEIGDCPAPTNLTATVYNRNYVVLDWQRPLRQDDIKADRYYISRNGEEIGVSDYAGFVDSVVPGTYQYTVRAEYTNSGVSAETAAVSATVSGKVAAYAPRNLSAVSYIDDKGESRVDLDWEVPYFGPEATVSCSEMEAGGQCGGQGMGFLYDKGKLAHLNNYVMDKVSFVLGRQGKYRVLVYKNGNVVYDAVLDSTKVNVNARTEVALSKPIKIEASASYMVAVVGNIYVGAGKGVTSDKSAMPIEGNKTISISWIDSTSTLYYSYFSEVNPTKMTGNYNIDAHFTALHNEDLAGENSDFEGYAIYRNGEKLPEVLVTEGMAYADEKLADGDYTYTVASVWKGGNDLQSNAVSKNVTSLYGAPDNFAGTVSVDTVSLTWQAPLSGAPVVKRWDSGKNAGKLGNKSGGIIYAASLFTPGDMKPFAGFSITQVEFFLAERVKSVAIVIFNGDEQIYRQDVPSDKLKLEDFNIIDLKQPVAFDANKDLRVGYMVNYSRDGRPIGVDATESADGKGNQISMDGKTWASASEQGAKNNFNIAFTVQYYNNKEVAAKGAAVLSALPEPAAIVFEPAFETVRSAKTSKLDNNEFSGFNVYRGEEKLTAEPIKDLAYTDITADSGRYAYKVSAVYTLTDEMFSQSLTFDTKKPSTGGDVPGTSNEWDAQADGVRIYPNPAVSTLYVSGAYDSFRLTDLYGRTVMPQTAAASAIEVSGLPAGQYLLILTKAGRESVQKITVR